METATINKLCLVPGVGTLIGFGTIAWNLPPAAFKGCAIPLYNSLAQQLQTELAAPDTNWYAERGAQLKVEVLSHLKQTGIGLIRLIPVIGAVWLVWKDFCETKPSEAYVNRLCIIPGLGTVIGCLTLMDHHPLWAVAKISFVVFSKALSILRNHNILAPTPQEFRAQMIEDYNLTKYEVIADIRMTLIAFIRFIPVVGGAALALNDHYRIIPWNSAAAEQAVAQ